MLLLILSLFALGLILFGIYPEFAGNPINRAARIIYEATSRIIWGAGLAYLMYSCVTHSGFIDKILSFKIWIPLSRFLAWLSLAIFLHYLHQLLPFLIQDYHLQLI
jgi:hypothetical protein